MARDRGDPHRSNTAEKHNGSMAKITEVSILEMIALIRVLLEMILEMIALSRALCAPLSLSTPRHRSPPHSQSLSHSHPPLASKCTPIPRFCTVHCISFSACAHTVSAYRCIRPAPPSSPPSLPPYSSPSPLSSSSLHSTHLRYHSILQPCPVFATSPSFPCLFPRFSPPNSRWQALTHPRRPAAVRHPNARPKQRFCVGGAGEGGGITISVRSREKK